MKAWQLTAAGEPLALNEVAEPTAAPGEVVIDIRAAGLCHSDIGILEDAAFLPPGGVRPMTIGHEIAGVISALGDGVTDWKIGDRVGICPVRDPAPGLTRDGGYTYKVSVPTDFLARIPDGLAFEPAAAGTDSGVTSYHAVKVLGQVTNDTKVGIIGLGGLGQIGARVAQLLGGEVFVAEIKEEVWPVALEMGIEHVARDISEFAHENLDVIIDFAGFGTTTAAAVLAVRRGGRVVQVGMGVREATISTYDLITKQVQLLGNLGGELSDLVGIYDLMASGEVTPVLSTITFDEIPAGLERLARGEVVGRLVATISA